MNPTATTKAKQAFTLIELLVVVAIIVIGFMFFLPAVNRGEPRKAPGVVCMNNLKQIGLGLIIYSDDNKSLFPWQVSTNQGGTEELIPNGVAAEHFLKLVRYVQQPRLFVCPTDKARRVAGTNFVGFSNSNLSYFIAPGSIINMTNPANAILAGDRHLAFNNQPVKPGLFSISNNAAMSWTRELHNDKNHSACGALQFADGRAAIVKTEHLPNVLTTQALTTNRLVIP